MNLELRETGTVSPRAEDRATEQLRGVLTRAIHRVGGGTRRQRRHKPSLRRELVCIAVIPGEPRAD